MVIDKTVKKHLSKDFGKRINRKSSLIRKKKHREPKEIFLDINGEKGRKRELKEKRKGKSKRGSDRREKRIDCEMEGMLVVWMD